MIFNPDIHPVEVFSGTMWEAGLLKSLLEDAGITVYLQDDIRGTYAPWQVTPGGAGAVKIVVSSEDLASASEVVEEYNKNLKRPTTDDEWEISPSGK